MTTPLLLRQAAIRSEISQILFTHQIAMFNVIAHRRMIIQEHIEREEVSLILKMQLVRCMVHRAEEAHRSDSSAYKGETCPVVLGILEAVDEGYRIRVSTTGLQPTYRSVIACMHEDGINTCV